MTIEVRRTCWWYIYSRIILWNRNVAIASNP